MRALRRRLGHAVLIVLAFTLCGPSRASDAGSTQHAGKPTALDVELRVVEEDGDWRRLALSVRASRPVRELSWSLATRGGALILSGPTSGRAHPEDDAVDADGFGAPQALAVNASITLRVPNDAERHELELRATAIVRGTDAAGRVSAEEVGAETWLRWDSAPPSKHLPPSSAARELLPARWQPGAGARARAADPESSQASALTAFTVSGSLLYRDKSWDFSGWTGADPLLAVRHANVLVFDATTLTLLGSGSSEADGNYAIECAADGATDIAVRVDADTSFDPGRQRVRCQSPELVLYAAVSPVFARHDPGFDLDAGSLIVEPFVAGGGDEVSPFNVFDLGVRAFEFVNGAPLHAQTATTPVEIQVPSPTPGSATAGNLVKIDKDDAFDDAVVLHELGHAVQFLYCDSDSLGGAHSFGDSDQDPRLALTEGFATFFGSAVLAEQGLDPVYVDLFGETQTGGIQARLSLETGFPFAGSVGGAADEVAVAAVWFDLVDGADTADATPGVDDDPLDAATLIGGQTLQRAWWAVLSGPMSGADSLNQSHFWDGWFAVHAADPHAAELTQIFTSWKQRFVPDALEPDPAVELVPPSPVFTDASWQNTRTLYAPPPGGGIAPGDDDADWFAHELVIGSRVIFRTRYPDSVLDAETMADTRLDVFDPGGQLVASDLNSGFGRNAFVAALLITETGRYTARVTAEVPQGPFAPPFFRRYGAYDYRAAYVFQNHAPVIAKLTASPTTIFDDESSLITADIGDLNTGQQLTHEWSAMPGGTLNVMGSSALFSPPKVSAPTEFEVQLLVRDELGAESTLASVSLLVSPAPALCSQPASVASVGAGKPGSFGVPGLFATGLPSVPSQDLVLRADSILPGLSGFLVAGFGQIDQPFDLGVLHPSPDIVVSVKADAAGELSLPVALPADPALCGTQLLLQVVFLGDPSALGNKQTSQSNALSLVLGG